MTEKDVIDTLRDFGLTEKESKVYIFLAKIGAQKAGALSKSLRMHKAQVYHILKNLQSKGVVESTIEFPMSFTAIPFEKFFDLIIKTKQHEAKRLEDKKNEMLGRWKSISFKKPTSHSEKFAIIRGTANIYSRMLQMVEKAEKEVVGVTTGSGLIRANQAGLIDSIKNRNIPSRFLIDVTKENLKIIKRIIKKISVKIPSLKVRHINLSSGIRPHFVIKDGDAVTFLITPKPDSYMPRQQDVGFWTNSEFVVFTITLFEELWRNAIDIDRKIREIETGELIEETAIIRDPEAAYKKFQEKICSAKEEITKITSSKGLVRFLNYCPIQELTEKGVKIRIIAPINEEEQVGQLLEHCQIRYTALKCLRMAVVDNRDFFLFKMPPADKETAKLAEYFENMFYTNDLEYVEKMSELLNEIWATSLDISEISSEAVMRSPPVTVSTSDPTSKVMEELLKNNIGSVIVVEDNKPVGIITEKDLLERAIKAHREPSRTLAKEIMSTPLETIDSSETLIRALEIMQNRGIRRLAVTKRGKLTGILTERRALDKIGQAL